MSAENAYMTQTRLLARRTLILPTTDPNTGNDNPDTGDDTANTVPEKGDEPSSENKQPLPTPETPKADNPYTFDGGVVRYFGIAIVAMISIAAVIRYGVKR